MSTITTADLPGGIDITREGEAVKTITVSCRTCGETASWPDKGLGRASASAWETHHQGHDYTRSTR